MNCFSQCDCDGPDVILGIDHAPDCNSRRICDDGRYCDKHFAENEAYWRSEFYNAGGSTDAATTDRMRQDLIDAGRGHLVDGVLADRIDMARMREKDSK